MLRHCFNWKKLSICAAIAYHWRGRRARLFFSIVSGSYTDEKLIHFLGQLHRELPRRRVILIWDGLPSHRSRCMQQFLKLQLRWLSVVQLPAYAPDLNPVEYAWGNIQAKELANLCSDDLNDMTIGVRRGFTRICESKVLVDSFLHHAGISFDRHVNQLCRSQ